MKYKRWLIFIGIIFSLVAVVTILSFTLFSTRNVCVTLHNQSTLFSGEQEQCEIIKSANINNKQPIYSLNKKSLIDNLEKRNPYLKVINLETIFPNKLVIHCAEREELFCFKIQDNLFYICDGELKILKTITNYQTQQSNPISIEGVNISNIGSPVGEKILLNQGQEILTNLESAFANSNRQVEDIKAMIKNIGLKNEISRYTYNVSPTIILTTYDDFKIHIRNANLSLNKKINLMLSIVPNVAKYYANHELYIDINPEDVNDISTELKEII